MALGVVFSILGCLLLSISYRPGISLRNQNVLFIFGTFLLLAGGISLGQSHTVNP